MNWWRASKRPEEWATELDPQRKSESETGPPQKQDRILALQRSVGNQAVQKLLPPTEGEPIEEETRQELEAAFGKDLSEVRVHRDQEAAGLAAEVGADAFTSGRDIYFTSGAYTRATLAHEVSHVVQQSEAGAIGDSENSRLEHEARTASSAVISGHMAEVSHGATAPAMQRQASPGNQASSLKLPRYSLTLDDFDIEKHSLKDMHKAKLDEFAEGLQQILSATPGAVVSIVGYADAPGPETYNLDLGQRRADVVRDYLVEKGAPDYALRAHSLGEESLLVASKGFEAKNRRVEISVWERVFNREKTTTARARAQDSVATVPRPEKEVKHEPAKMPGQEEHEQASKDVKKGDEARKARKDKDPGTSLSDFFGQKARELAKEAKLSKWLQDRAESLGRELPGKTVQVIADEIARDKGLSQTEMDALNKVIDAASKSKVP